MPLTTSIAMATFNGEKYVRDQLESFTNQKKLPDELVVNDDCSTDATVRIIEDFSRSSPFKVNIFTNEKNVGYVKNFELAISRCKNDIIFLSDQDDYWYENKIEFLLDLYEKSKNILCITNNNEISDKDLNPTGYSTLGNVRRIGHSDRSFVHGCCTSFRRELGGIILPLATGISHDGWIGILSDAVESRIVIDEQLQLYRQHENNVSLWVTSKPERKSRFAELLSYGLADAREGWRRECMVLDQLHTRIIACSEKCLEMGIEQETIARAVTKALAKRNALTKRIDLVAISRIPRTLAVAKFARDGGYAELAGWKSALKDLLR